MTSTEIRVFAASLLLGIILLGVYGWIDRERPEAPPPEPSIDEDTVEWKIEQEED